MRLAVLIDADNAPRTALKGDHGRGGGLRHPHHQKANLRRLDAPNMEMEAPAAGHAITPCSSTATPQGKIPPTRP